MALSVTEALVHLIGRDSFVRNLLIYSVEMDPISKGLAVHISLLQTNGRWYCREPGISSVIKSTLFGGQRYRAGRRVKCQASCSSAADLDFESLAISKFRQG